jgi:hypothetical protein
VSDQIVNVVNSTTIDLSGTITNTVTNTNNAIPAFSEVTCVSGNSANTITAAKTWGANQGAIYVGLFNVDLPPHKIAIGAGISWPGTGPTGVALPALPGVVPGPLPVPLPAMPCLSRCFYPF